MATSTPAHVTPEVLRWAREKRGWSIEEAASKVQVTAEKLANAEAGDALLTMRQAETAARRYGRTLATLFLPEPPPAEPQDQQFRRLPGAPPPPWPPELEALVRRVRERQEAASELLEFVDERARWSEASKRFRVDQNLLPQVARMELGVTTVEQTGWRDYSGYAPLRAWIDAVEALGVLVMQDGTLSVPQMRGFAAEHPVAPTIVVNTNDDPRARAWTVIHELGHLCLATGPATEEWCEDFAGEVIMPDHWFRERFAQLRRHDPLELVDELAMTFGVTPKAAAVRIARKDLLPKPVIQGAIRRIEARQPRSSGPGGDPYRTQIARLGPAFTRLVLDAIDSRSLPLSNAAGLLGTKVNNFGQLRETLSARGSSS